jgi:hypothetical protein
LISDAANSTASLILSLFKRLSTLISTHTLSTTTGIELRGTNRNRVLSQTRDSQIRPEQASMVDLI